MTVDLVIFDCDGVLVDSEGPVRAAVADELAGLGLSAGAGLLGDLLGGRALTAAVPPLARCLGTDLPPDFAARCRGRLLEDYRPHLRATPGLPPLLAGLRPAFCAVSVSGPERLGATLSAAGLDRFFGDRTFSAAEVARPPPAPDLFLLAARRMGADPLRTLVVEDSPSGLVAARSAGMRALLYAGAGHLAGADLSDWADDVTILADWSDFPPAFMSHAGQMPVH
ncbi:HAD family hydrolase [Histidinibacterium lentulum]|uniref:phosphoglycolate phosphatase n=1 Tax=Histidinibacterium lentulum TaxID=2480588 RepID=A0A3N2R8Y1_9RHOB|nr:HAD-IA family hydrolase [Histidinibacterium lentulum]ROU03930.1 hydrolase [Histidinibacterium lentulum]